MRTKSLAEIRQEERERSSNLYRLIVELRAKINMLETYLGIEVVKGVDGYQKKESAFDSEPPKGHKK